MQNSKAKLFSFIIRSRFVLFFRGLHLNCQFCVSSVTDFYAVLGVNRNADANEIRSSYLKLCKQFHPDANPQQSSATRRFQEINEAYSVLSNVIKRREYDSGRMSPMGSRTTSRDGYYGSYSTQYHRPFEDFTARDEFYGQNKAYQSEYERFRHHEEGIRTGRIKPIRTSFTVYSLIIGIIVTGIIVNVIRAMTISKLLNSDKELSTQQLKEYRRLQQARLDRFPSEEHVTELNRSTKLRD